MSTARTNERRTLSDDEAALVARSHHPVICGEPDETLLDLLRLLGDRRDKAQTIARRQRREMRGKASAADARPAADETGSSKKAAALSQAVKRANKEFTRRRNRSRQSQIAVRAMALQAGRKSDPRPQSRTAHHGMNPTERRTAPSGALDAEGHRPVLERSRKAR